MWCLDAVYNVVVVIWNRFHGDMLPIILYVDYWHLAFHFKGIFATGDLISLASITVNPTQLVVLGTENQRHGIC